MWEFDHKEIWAPKNWCFRTVLLEKTLESPLDYKGIQPVNPKADKSRVFIARTDVETEAPILWPPDVKRWLTGKDHDAWENWMQEKGMTEDEMVRDNHWLSGHEFNQTQGDSGGQESLACCSPWSSKKSNTSEQLNNSNNNSVSFIHLSILNWTLICSRQC